MWHAPLHPLMLPLLLNEDTLIRAFIGSYLILAIQLMNSCGWEGSALISFVSPPSTKILFCSDNGAVTVRCGALPFAGATGHHQEGHAG